MAIYFLLLLFLLLIVFLLSKAFIKNLYLLFYLIFRSKFWAIQLTTLILLPGTIIHELSHLIIAEILRVPTGEISFTPKIGDNEQIKAGSLKIASVDPFRRTLVGLAPLLAGLTIILLTSKFYFVEKFFPFNINQLSNLPPATSYLLPATCYALFAISNTMFSSKKDLEAAILPAIILFMITGAFYLGQASPEAMPATRGFSIGVKSEAQEVSLLQLKLGAQGETPHRPAAYGTGAGVIKNILTGINLSLGLTILIDLVFLGVLKLFFLFFRKILKRKSAISYQLSAILYLQNLNRIASPCFPPSITMGNNNIIPPNKNPIIS